MLVQIFIFYFLSTKFHAMASLLLPPHVLSGILKKENVHVKMETVWLIKLLLPARKTQDNKKEWSDLKVQLCLLGLLIIRFY